MASPRASRARCARPAAGSLHTASPRRRALQRCRGAWRPRAMMAQRLHRLGNRRAVPIDELPRLTIDSFRSAVIGAVADGWRIVSLFGTPENARTLRLLAVLADDERAQLGAASAVVGERYPALAPDCP